jgi:YbbR domain-containing protein
LQSAPAGFLSEARPQVGTGWGMDRLKALIGVLLVVAAFYAAWMLLPPYINNYQFQDDIQNEALINTYSSKTEQDIRNTLAKKAAEYGIPLKAEQINVQRSGAELSIWADYTVHVDLPGFPLDLKFHPATKNKRI